MWNGGDPRLWKAWALFRQPNLFLALSSLAYVAMSIAIYTIGFDAFYEAKDALNDNVASRHSPTDGVTPCGLATPDLLMLQQALGIDERGVMQPMDVTPAYHHRVDRAKMWLCSVEHDWPPAPPITDTPSTPNQAHVDTSILRGLSLIMGRTKYQPITFGDATGNGNIKTALKADLCNTDSNDEDLDHIYSSRLQAAYPDLRLRVERAYIAALPSFYQYWHGGESGSTCLGDLDPFGAVEDYPERTCHNNRFVSYVLDVAASNGVQKTMLGQPIGGGSDDRDWLEKLYALILLSVIGHIDRTQNNGECFMNTNNVDAQAFCQSIYEGNGGGLNNYKYATGVSDFRDRYEGLQEESTCMAELPPASRPSAAPPPPPALNNTVTFTGSQTDCQGGLCEACAHQLQYGLIDQIRLFGMPDVNNVFQTDVRKGASSHLIAKLLLETLFENHDDDQQFRNRLSLLELWLAYRATALTIWLMLVGSVTGFFTVRAAYPLVLQAWKLVLGLENHSGEQHVLVRSERLRRSTLMAMIVALLAAYWTLFVDPAQPTVYPTSPSCKDWLDGRSGAYQTNWNGRRFARVPEAVAGLLLTIVAALPLIYRPLSAFMDPTTKKDREKIPKIAPNFMYFFGITVCLVTTLLAQVVNANDSGKLLKTRLITGYATSLQNDLLGRELKACIHMAFFSGGATGAVQSMWLFGEIPNGILRNGWGVSTLLLVWSPYFAYLSIVQKEHDRAWDQRGGQETRYHTQIVMVVAGILQSIIVAMLYKELRTAAPSKDVAEENREVRVDTADAAKAAEDQAQDAELGNPLIPRATVVDDTSAPRGLRHDVSRMHLLPLLPLKH